MPFQPGDLLWTRLEPDSSDPGMGEGLRAEVHDPLWFMTRQWQLGEFQGEDGGSPVDISVSVAHDHLTRYHLTGDGSGVDPEPYEGGPLESLVERERVLTERDRPDARLAAQAGIQFRRLLARNGPSSNERFGPGDFPEGYLLSALTDDPDEPVDATDLRFEDAVSDRVLDGHRVYRALRAARDGRYWRDDGDDVALPWEGSNGGSGPASLPVPDGVDPSTGWYEMAAAQFLEWYAALYDEPTEESGSAWDPGRLEYRFDVSTGGPGGDPEGPGDTETVLTSGEYRGGRLDWYSFGVHAGDEGAPTADPSETLQDQAEGVGVLDVGGLGSEDGDGNGDSEREGPPSLFPSDAEADDARTETDSKHVMPTRASFKGMPNKRYWAFEDADVRLDEISVDDVSDQVLVNFALVYGNDWYTFPVDSPLGSLTRITDLTITDTFGEETDSRPVTDAPGDWNVFMLEDLPSVDQPGIFLPPVLDHTVESDPVEDVSIGRDEMANLAFAVETRVESPAGTPVDRDTYSAPHLILEEVAPDSEVAEEYVAFHNPGNRPLDVGGWVVTDGDVTFSFPTGTTVPPDTTVYLHSGTEAEAPGENSDVDFYWGAPKGPADDPEPVWYRESAVALSVYDAGAAGSEGSVTASAREDRPLEHLRLRDRIPGTDSGRSPSASYRLATDLPNHWFALEPVRERSVEGLEVDIEHYLRLALVLDADTLDASDYDAIPDPEGEILHPYQADPDRMIYDEEVLRGGKRITRTYQKAQWIDGSTYLWSGRAVAPGADEVGSSTLQFDVLSGWAEDEES